MQCLASLISYRNQIVLPRVKSTEPSFLQIPVLCPLETNILVSSSHSVCYSPFSMSKIITLSVLNMVSFLLLQSPFISSSLAVVVGLYSNPSLLPLPCTFCCLLFPFQYLAQPNRIETYSLRWTKSCRQYRYSAALQVLLGQLDRLSYSVACLLLNTTGND